MAVDCTRPRNGSTPRRIAREVRSDLDQFVVRLRLLGASEDEVAATVKAWDNLDADFTEADRARMVRWTDTQILAELVALRAEYERHTTP